MDFRYWDANAFLGWLKAEADRVDACRGVLEAAQAGQVRIVTSALTLVEVIKLSRETQIPKSDAKVIRDFFQNSFIDVKDVNRYIAETARELIWDHELSPKDAVHVATAVRFRIRRVETFDKHLLGMDGKVGSPALHIAWPGVDQQRLSLSCEGETTDGLA